VREATCGRSAFSGVVEVLLVKAKIRAREKELHGYEEARK
jgi:hypothetical protein